MLADVGPIVVVDDDPTLREMVIRYLEDHNVPTKSASNKMELNRHFQGNLPSLIILDLRLGQEDGLDLLREIRSHSDVPVIITTGHRPDEIDRIVGLELGADDYMIKPFSLRELLARVRSLLRRGPARCQETIRMADLEIDLLRQRATRAGHRLDLTSKEFLLLTLLARRAGEVLTRTSIAEAVWDMNFDSDTNVVDVNVRRLRAKVDEPFPLKLIHTVRGAGYVMECDQ